MILHAAPAAQTPALDRSPEEPGPPGQGNGGVRRYRTVWISDVHLGTKACKAERLCEFLARVECERLYLVGDIVDGWQLERRWSWSPAQTEVVRALIDRARGGTQVVWVPGNHDEMLRGHGEFQLAGVDVRPEVVHETADGRRLLVVHGDEFDAIVRNHLWLSHLGDWAYQVAHFANIGLNAVRRRLGRPYWSLAGWLKQRVKDAVSYVSEFERAIAAEARHRGMDGVVCGHIHKAELREIDGVLYANDGDWVESCTALVEHADGRLEILQSSGHLTSEASAEPASLVAEQRASAA